MCSSPWALSSGVVSSGASSGLVTATTSAGAIWRCTCQPGQDSTQTQDQTAIIPGMFMHQNLHKLRHARCCVQMTVLWPSMLSCLYTMHPAQAPSEHNVWVTGSGTAPTQLPASFTVLILSLAGRGLTSQMRATTTCAMRVARRTTKAMAASTAKKRAGLSRTAPASHCIQQCGRATCPAACDTDSAHQHRPPPSETPTSTRQAQAVMLLINRQQDMDATEERHRSARKSTCGHALNAHGAGGIAAGGQHDAVDERLRVRNLLARGEARCRGGGGRGLHGDLHRHLHLKFPQVIERAAHRKYECTGP